MSTYQDLPNELREQVFLNSIETLQDLQQKCRVNIQSKLYCDKHFTSPITPILEAIRDVINQTANPTLGPDPRNRMHSIEIYTNDERNFITITGDLNSGIDAKIYTKLRHKRILFDILKHNKTKSNLSYATLVTTPFRTLVVYSRNQTNISTFARDYFKISIN
jgi:hypothetical protein